MHTVTLFVPSMTPNACTPRRSVAPLRMDLSRPVWTKCWTKDDIKIDDCLRYVFDPGESPPGTSIFDSAAVDDSAYVAKSERLRG